jgi:hypothetical protein
MTLATWFRGALDSDLEALLLDDVDDLAKFNLLLLMHRVRGLRADAAFLASSLGFHSVEQTEQKLRELAGCGLVNAETASGGGHVVYSLSEDGTARRRLAKLWRLARREAYFTSLLQHLAERSVEEAEAKRRRGAPSAD